MTDKYDVGYQKPPKKSQFQPGKSGNPKGRPKGSKNLRTLLEEELLQIVTIKENGCAKGISKKQALIKQIVNKAASGDLRAILQVKGR